MENWKNVCGFSAYEVSDMGLVRRRLPGGNATHIGKVLSQVLVRGYRHVGLVSDNSGRKMVAVHRIVCAAFHGEKSDKSHQVRHLDGNKCNNMASNLAWGTSKENHADRFAHGTAAQGEKNGRSILTRDEVKQIRYAQRSRGVCQSLASKFGVSIGTINMIRQRNSPVWKDV